MSAKYVHTGNHVQFFAPKGGVFSGRPLLIGATFVIPVGNASENEKFVGTVHGVWELPKARDEAIGQGVAIYWHESTGDQAGYATVAASGGVLIGKATWAAQAGKETVEVRLNG